MKMHFLFQTLEKKLIERKKKIPIYCGKRAKFAKQYVFRKILGKHHTKTVIQLVKLFLEIKFDKLNFGLEVEFGKLDF